MLGDGLIHVNADAGWARLVAPMLLAVAAPSIMLSLDHCST